MKTCSKCREAKPLSAFNKRKEGTQGVGSWCKLCHSAYDKARNLAADKSVKAKQNAALREAKRPLMLAYLKEHPCVVCGEDDPIVLEFDHRDPETKSFNVARMMSSHSWPKILAEIKKCDVLCANCHRRKTARQRGWWKSFEDAI